MTAAKPKTMGLNFTRTGPLKAIGPLKAFGPRAALAAPLTAVFDDDDLTITLTIDVIDGAPECVEYSVKPTKRGGLLTRTTEIARGYNLRSLVAVVCGYAALERVDKDEAKRRGGLTVDVGDDAVYSSVASVAAIEAVVGPIRRRRAPVTDDRLREVAEQFREHYQPGKMSDFGKRIGAEERHAWRLVKLARDRGFLARKDDGK